MPALDPAMRERWRGSVAVDRDDRTIGIVTGFYLDRATGLPGWAVVLWGWLTERRSLLPLRDAVEQGGEVRVPYTRALVRASPRIEPDGRLEPDDERALVEHYRLHELAGAVAEPPPDRD